MDAVRNLFKISAQKQPENFANLTTETKNPAKNSPTQPYLDK